MICKAQPPEGLGKGEESVYGEITDLSLWAAFSSGNPAVLGKRIGRNPCGRQHRGWVLSFLMGAILPPWGCISSDRCHQERLKMVGLITVCGAAW